jgi:hypothetical protein
VASQLREDLQQQELALKRKLGNEAAARRAAEDELRTVRQELSQLQGMLGPGMFGTSAAAGLGGLGLQQQQQQVPGQQLGDSWRAAAGGPPALAAPGFKWMLVREGEDPTAAAAAEDELGSSLPGTPHSVLSGGFGTGSRNLHRAGSTASSGAVGGGGFDTSELLLQQHTGHSFSSTQQQQQNQQHGAISGAMSDAASAYGGSGGHIPVSPTRSASVQQLQQQQMRQVAARLGSGSVGEATLQRLRAALRQKTGECAALEGRLRELEATRDQLAGELVAATHTAEKVRLL